MTSSATASRFVKDALVNDSDSSRRGPCIHNSYDGEVRSSKTNPSTEMARFTQHVEGNALVSYQKSVAKLLGRQSTRFPGSQPATFTRANLNQIVSEQFLVCEKTDGVRYLLYLVADHNEDCQPQNRQILINRKNEYLTILPGLIRAPRNVYEHGIVYEWHRGTLLDGELVWQHYPHKKSRLSFLIFDCLAVNGKSAVKLGYEGRRAFLEKNFYEPWESYMQRAPSILQSQSFNLYLKHAQPIERIEKLLKNDIPKLPHRNDGIIFACKNSPYCFGTDHSTMKWKEPKDITIDFMVKSGKTKCYGAFEQQYRLFVYHGNSGHKYFAPLSLTKSEHYQMNNMCWSSRFPILECFRDIQTGFWRPKLDVDGTLLVRHDKPNANHVKVVTDILKALEDAVSAQDLLKSMVDSSP